MVCRGGWRGEREGCLQASVEEFGQDEAAEGEVTVDRVVRLAEGGALQTVGVGDAGAEVDQLDSSRNEFVYDDVLRGEEDVRVGRAGDALGRQRCQDS